MEVARGEFVRCPQSAPVRSLSELVAWLDNKSLPAVLKTDGSWGGNGVAIVHDRSEAAKAYSRLVASPSVLRGLKRGLLNGDFGPIQELAKRTKPGASIQAFVEGRPGNAAVACMEGKVLAAVYVEVIRSQGATGPGTVVRVIEHPEMAWTVRAMVARLGLSGLCGFDFILDPHSGTADLIEINPRATPTCHLTSVDGRGLSEALIANLRRVKSPKPRSEQAHGLVALFPQEMRRDPDSPFLQHAYHDVPLHAPDLVQMGLAAATADRKSIRKALDSFRRQFLSGHLGSVHQGQRY